MGSNWLLTARNRLFFKAQSMLVHPHEIAPIFLKLDVGAEGWFYSYYIHQGNKSDKKKEIARNKK